MYQKSRKLPSPVTQAPKTVSTDTIARLMRENEDLVKNWRKLYTTLKISEDRVKEIENGFAEFQNPLKLILTILTYWVWGKGREATVCELLRSLQQLGCRKLPGLGSIYGYYHVITNSYDVNRDEIVSEIFSHSGLGQYRISISPLLKLLSEVGSRQTILVSVNGKWCDRKIFVVNKIANFFRQNSSRNTLKGTEIVNYKRTNANYYGIYVWNEPFFIQTREEEIGVILMITNDAIEQQLPFQISENTTGLSVLLSSVNIFVETTGTDQNQWAENVAPEIRWFCGQHHNKKLILLSALDLDCINYSNSCEKLYSLFSDVTQLPNSQHNHNHCYQNADERAANIILHYLASIENWHEFSKQVMHHRVNADQMIEFVIRWTASIISKEQSNEYIGQVTDSIAEITNNTLSMIKLEEFVETCRRSLTKTRESLYESLSGGENVVFEPQNLNNFISTFSERTNRIIEHNHSIEEQRKISATIENKIVETIGNYSIPKLTYRKDRVIGRGSNETVVYRGEFGKLNVAVKRLNSTHFDIATRAKTETEALMRLTHENVVRYFNEDKQDGYILIALELCDMSLKNWVQDESAKTQVNISVREIILQSTKGIEYLHQNKMIHRDIKPDNILLAVDDVTGRVSVKISDFGFCKNFPKEKSSITITSAPGSFEWLAPEVLRFVDENETGSVSEKMNNKTDMFSFGCVIAYTMTDGQHPFGSPLRRQVNILNGELQIDYEKLQEMGHDDAKWLIILLLSNCKEKRPTASATLAFPTLWTNNKKSEFLDKADKCLRAKDNQKKPLSKVKEQEFWLEKRSFYILSNSPSPEWESKLCHSLRTHLGIKTRNIYKYNKVSELLRLIRNLQAHDMDGEIPEEVKTSVGFSSEDYAHVDYWCSRFPLLIPLTWLALQPLKNYPGFEFMKNFYPTDFEFDREIVLTDKRNTQNSSIVNKATSP